MTFISSFLTFDKLYFRKEVCGFHSLKDLSFVSIYSEFPAHPHIWHFFRASNEKKKERINLGNILHEVFIETNFHKLTITLTFITADTIR